MRKLSIQLIGAVLVCFLFSMGVLTLLSQVVIRYYLTADGTIDQTYYNVTYLLIMGSAVLAFIIPFLLIINRKVKYLTYITRRVDEIAKDQLGSTLEVKGNDELTTLSRNINTLSIQLKEKFEREREIEQAKTELITNVSHDLRTPLTSLIGYLDLLNTNQYDTKEKGFVYVSSAYQLSLKLKTRMDELFEYTKLSNHDFKFSLEQVEVGLILSQLVGEYAPSLEKKGLRVSAEIQKENLRADIDIEKIVRVFDNLLSNVEKYSKTPSEVIITAKKQDGYVLVSIRNETDGVGAGSLSKWFEKFYRADESRSNEVEGSGLGLAIAKRIMDLHQGRIWAESDGQFVTMYVELKGGA